MADFVFRVDALPTDVVELLASFLHGLDLLRFSHVTQRLLTELLAPNAHEWERRLCFRVARDGRRKIAKHRYVTDTSVQFAGREINKATRKERGGAIALWSTGMPDYWGSDSFSIDLWFAMLPVDAHAGPTVYAGGVILGAQSVYWGHSSWANNHQQFIHVDPSGNLYCSVTDEKTIVASNLKPRRWYHLALTVDRSDVADALPTQLVYLDGVAIHQSTADLHHKSRSLYYGQLGSGCISGGSQGQPTQDFCGWYGFNGTVDGCRLWRGVLQPTQVSNAAAGQAPELIDDEQPVMEWSMDTGDSNCMGLSSRVRCTRPLERVYIQA